LRDIKNKNRSSKWLFIIYIDVIERRSFILLTSVGCCASFPFCFAHIMLYVMYGCEPEECGLVFPYYFVIVCWEKKRENSFCLACVFIVYRTMHLFVMTLIDCLLFKNHSILKVETFQRDMGHTKNSFIAETKLDISAILWSMKVSWKFIINKILMILSKLKKI
jgi:hypothetical protein